MDVLQKTDLEGFSRDTTSQAILNTSKTRLMAYKKKKKRMAMVTSLDGRVAAIEADLEHIKILLEKLVNGNNSTN